MPRVVVIAARAHNIGSVAIRTAQLWRAWSHTADVLTAGDYTGTVEALALHGGVVCETVEGLKARSSRILTLSKEVSSDAAAARDAWLLRQEGKPYDWLGAGLAAWWQWRRWNDDDAWWCSEMSTASVAHIGALTVSPYIRGVMPTDCVDLLIAAGFDAQES